MKKIIYKSLACLCLLSIAFSCSTDADVDMQSSRSENFTAKTGGSIWDTALAQDDGNGGYKFLVSERELITELEAILEQQGTPAKLEYLGIREKIPTNNASLKGYMLIGGSSPSSGISVGVSLVKQGGNYFSPGIGGGGGPRKAVSCRGCGSGCFLEYYDIDGHFVPYCDSAGCGPYCDKIESSMY